MKRAYLKLAPPRPSCPHQLYAMQVCSENKICSLQLDCGGKAIPKFHPNLPRECVASTDGRADESFGVNLIHGPTRRSSSTAQTIRMPQHGARPADQQGGPIRDQAVRLQPDQRSSSPNALPMRPRAWPRRARPANAGLRRAGPAQSKAVYPRCCVRTS
jgi:hypothetical protein